MFADRPDGEISYDLSTKDKVAKMKDTPFVLKQGCQYKFKIVFKVQHEIVSGLKYVNVVSRKGVKVAKDNVMIGSFGPQAEPHSMIYPRQGFEEAPTGMLARGDYKALCRFVDDDG